MEEMNSCWSGLKRQREETTTQVEVELEVEEVMIGEVRKEQEEEVEEEEEQVSLKRQKSYEDIIITLLKEDEDEPTQDLSSLISSLQQEISVSSSSSYGPAQSAHNKPDSSIGPGSGSEEGEEKSSVMKHLLNASDDELGLPNTTDTISTSNFMMDDGFDDQLLEEHVDGGDYFLPVVGGEGVWEFEDHEAANYYSFVIQQSSQIFL